MRIFNLIGCMVNFALVFVWTFTDRTDMAILNGVAAILCAIWATHPGDAPCKS